MRFKAWRRRKKKPLKHFVTPGNWINIAVFCNNNLRNKMRSRSLGINIGPPGSYCMAHGRIIGYRACWSLLAETSPFSEQAADWGGCGSQISLLKSNMFSQTNPSSLYRCTLLLSCVLYAACLLDKKGITWFDIGVYISTVFGTGHFTWWIRPYLELKRASVIFCTTEIFWVQVFLLALLRFSLLDKDKNVVYDFSRQLCTFSETIQTTKLWKINVRKVKRCPGSQW